MPLAAAGIGAAGSILGGITGGKGAAKAAKIEAQTQQQALQLQQNEFNTISGDATPNIQAGNTAVQSIMQMLGIGSTGAAGQTAALNQIQQGPMYQSEFNSGLQGVDQSLAASGGLRGGNGALAQSDFGSQLLNSLYQQQIGNLGTVAGFGQGALGTLSSSGSNMVDASSKTLSNLGQDEGTAAASPYAALASALSGLSGVAGKYYGSTSLNSGVVGAGYIPTTTSAAPTIASLLGNNLGYSPASPW